MHIKGQARPNGQFKKSFLSHLLGYMRVVNSILCQMQKCKIKPGCEHRTLYLLFQNEEKLTSKGLFTIELSLGLTLFEFWRHLLGGLRQRFGAKIQLVQV